MKTKKIFIILALMMVFIGCKKFEKAPSVTITSFDPQKLSPYNYITIYGSHFDTSALKNLVSFNGVPSTVFLVEGDSILNVIVPQNVTPGKISITVNGNTVTSENSYTVLPGGWIRKADVPFVDAPPNDARVDGIGFAIGNTGYIGLGTANGGAFSDLNAYDPITNKWTKKSSLPIGLQSAFSMVIYG
jgi:hypothetical protein